MKNKNKSGRNKIFCYRLWKNFWRYIRSNIITWKYVAYNIVKSLNSNNVGLLLLCKTTLKIAVVYVRYIEYIAIITRGFILEVSVDRSIPSYFLWRRYALLSTLLHFSMSWIWWVDFWGGRDECFSLYTCLTVTLLPGMWTAASVVMQPLDLADLLSALAEVDAVTWNNNLSVLVFLIDTIESCLEWSSLASICLSGFTLLYSLRL